MLFVWGKEGILVVCNNFGGNIVCYVFRNSWVDLSVE